MTVGDLLTRISSAELTEWFALAAIEAREQRDAQRQQAGGRGDLSGAPQWGRGGGWRP